MMGMKNEPIIRNVGVFGNYKVMTVYENGMSHVPTEKKTPDGVETKLIRISKNRKAVRLIHVKSGETVEFRAYVHQKLRRFRDMRERVSHTNDLNVVAEMRRMLAVNDDEARKLLALAA